MKKLLQVIALLLALLLLCSCGAKSAEKPAEEEQPEEEQPDEAVSSDFDAEDCTFVLWECEDFRVDLLVFLASDGSPCWLLRGTPHTQEEIYVRFNDAKYNGEFVLDDYISLHMTDGEPYEIFLMGDKTFGGILPTEITAYATAEIGTKERDRRISWTRPEDFVPHLICEPIYEAKADTQVLADNDRVKITLVCFGKVYEYNSDWGDFFAELGGFLLVENKTDGTIPTQVSGATVNGATIAAYSDATELLAGTQCLLYFTLGEYKLEEFGIDSISDVSLQVMTDISENTGTAYVGYYEGGSWYPVMLSQSGDAGDAEPGKVIYEDNTLQISVLGFEEDTYRHYITGDDGEKTYVNYYEWKLMIVNKGDQDIYLDVHDEKVGEEELSQSAYFDPINAGTYLIDTERFWYYDGEPAPKVSFSFDVCTKGGSAMLYSVVQQIVLLPEN